MVSKAKRRKEQVEQCREIYEGYRRRFGIVKSLSLTTQEVRETIAMSDNEAREIVSDMWEATSHCLIQIRSKI